MIKNGGEKLFQIDRNGEMGEWLYMPRYEQVLTSTWAHRLERDVTKGNMVEGLMFKQAGELPRPEKGPAEACPKVHHKIGPKRSSSHEDKPISGSTE